MATEIKMPQLGETVVEGTISKWLKKEGDHIEADEYIVEISTDKVDSEVPSSASGVIQKILVQEGETVNVGTPIAIVGEEGEAAAEEEPQEEQKEDKAEEQPEAEEKSEPDKKQEKEQEEEEQPAAESKSREEREAAPKEPSAEEQTPRPEKSEAPEKPAASGDTSKRGIISPLVRRLADENDVDLEEVSGTGTGGRIRKQDVLRYVAERKAKPAAKPAASAEPAPEPAPAARPAAAAVGGREELVPWTNIRRRTAEHMVASHLETARAWNAVEVDWTEAVRLRERAKAAFREREEFSLTYMPFLAKALCETLLEMPEVNSTFDEEQQGNRVKRYVNLGVAVALEGGGLIVPVVKGADELNLVGLARGISDVAARARSKKLAPDDIVGGTFSITNPGPFGSIISVPIIPQGQTAILGFEAIQKRLVVGKDDSLSIRSMGFLSMSWDHRAIDGAEAARFLAALRERIETTDFSPELAPYL